MIARFSSVLTVLALGACAAQGPTLNSQAEQMELALVSCKDQLGLAGQLQTVVSFDGGVADARAVAFDRITAADADQINACAGRSVTLADGMEVVPLQSVPMSVPQVETTLPVVAAPAAPAVISSGGCPAGVTGMYGGTGYCTGGAL